MAELKVNKVEMDGETFAENESMIAKLKESNQHLTDLNNIHKIFLEKIFLKTRLDKGSQEIIFSNEDYELDFISEMRTDGSSVIIRAFKTRKTN